MKLEPCPNCKTDKNLKVDTGSTNSYRQVYCTVCNAFGPLGNTALEARQKWNRQQKGKQGSTT